MKTNIKNYFAILIATMLMICGATAALADEIQFLDVAVQVDKDSTFVPTRIVNGGFDDEPWMNFLYDGVIYTLENKTTWKTAVTVDETYPNGIDQGWNTSEIQTYGGMFECEHGPDVYEVPEGTTHGRFVEMNNKNNAVLWQDLTTHGGDVVLWSLRHGFRKYVSQQTMRVEIGAPNGLATGIGNAVNANIKPETKATYLASGVTNPENAAYGSAVSLANLDLQSGTVPDWYDASGIYVIPEGQDVTRFAFTAINPTNGTGNLLDDLTFSTIIGNLKAVANGDGSVTVTGYWGDENVENHLRVKIDDTIYDLDMSCIHSENFIVTIPSSIVGGALEFNVFHQNYETAERKVSVRHPDQFKIVTDGMAFRAWCTNEEHSVATGCRYHGEENAAEIGFAADNMVWKGAPYDRATFTGNTAAWIDAGLAMPTLTYAVRGSGAFEPTAPSAVGDYTVRATIDGQSVEADFAIDPIMIDNVRFQQRYPWNGLVDIYADVYGAGGDITLHVSAYNGSEQLNVVIPEQERTVTLSDGLTPVHFVWDAESDIGWNNFRSEDITVCVSTRDPNAEPTAIAVVSTPIWQGECAIENWTSMGDLSWGGYDWSSVDVGKVLEVHYTLIQNGDYHEIRLGDGNWVALPSFKALPEVNGGENLPLTEDAGVVRIVLTEDDKTALTYMNSGLVVCGAWLVVNMVAITDAAPPVEPTEPEVSAWSEPGRVDLRNPILVTPGESDEITYSANQWNDQAQDGSVNIHFGTILTESIEELNALPVVFENLPGEGKKAFVYPEKTGSYMFVHKYIPPVAPKKQAQSPMKQVFVVWYIGADNPESVYALDRGDGEIYVMGEGYMKDFDGCGPWGTDITGVKIQNGVRNVGANAFSGCTKMTHVELPESMEMIGDGAFSGAAALKTIRCDAYWPPSFIDDPFVGIEKKNVCVYVPQEVVGDYEHDQDWAPFWIMSPSEYLGFEVYSFAGVSHTVKIDDDICDEGADYFAKDIHYGSKVIVTATITDENLLFDDGSTQKTFVWNFFTSADGVFNEIMPYGADWITLQNALVGNPPENLRGALEYADDNGTNVINLLRDISTACANDKSLSISSSAVIDLAGHAIVFGNGPQSVIGVGKAQNIAPANDMNVLNQIEHTYLPAWLKIVDSSDNFGMIIHGGGMKKAKDADYLSGGIIVLPGSTCVITGGKVADAINVVDSTAKVLISGGYFGTNVTLDHSWFVEGYEAVPNDEFVGYDKKVILTPSDVAQARIDAMNEIEQKAGLKMTRSDEMDDLVNEARDAIYGAYPAEDIGSVLADYLDQVAAQYAKDNPGIPETATATGKLDLRSHRELPHGQDVVGGITYSDSNWGESDADAVTITQKNLETGRTMTVAEGVTGSSEGTQMELFGQDSNDGLGHKLFHTVRGTVLESFVTFFFSGFEPGKPSNPWDAGEPNVVVYIDPGDPDGEPPTGPTLVIKGEGELFPNGTDVPWNDRRDEITEIFVASGVVLQEGSLAGYPNLQRIIFEDPNYRLSSRAMNGYWIMSVNPDTGMESAVLSPMIWPSDGVYVMQFNGRQKVTAFYNEIGEHCGNLELAYNCGYNPVLFSTVPKAMIDVFPAPSTVEPITDDNGDFEGWKVVLNDDLSTPVELPDDLGTVVIDLNGHDLIGREGLYDGMDDASRNGRPAFVIYHGGLEGEPLELTIIDSLPDDTPDVIGGKGADGNPAGNGGPAIYVDPEAYAKGAKVIVGPNVTVKGGDAGTGLGQDGEGGDVPPGTPGPVSQPGEGVVETLEGGTTEDGEQADGGVAAWATCNVGTALPSEWLKNLPRGLSYIDGRFWFWRRVGDKNGPATFDFGELPLALIASAGFTSFDIVFEPGLIEVDTIKAPVNFGFRFIGGENTTLKSVSGKSIFEVVGEFETEGPDQQQVIVGPVKPVVVDPDKPFIVKGVAAKAAGTEPEQAAAATEDPVVVWQNLTFTNGENVAVGRWGGAIRMEGGAMRVVNCTFENCFAEDYGGAIFAFGLERESSIESCRFENCIVDGIYGYGGAIYASAQVAGHAETGVYVRLTVSGSTFVGNAAVNGGAICTMRDANVDDLINEQPIELMISQTIFQSNAAEYDGGAIFAEGPVTIKGTAQGGLVPAVVDPNHIQPIIVGAVLPTSFYRNFAGGSGGAIAMDCVVGDWFVPAKLSVGENVRFDENLASNAYTYALGGAIAQLQPGGELEVFGAKFTDNTAIATGINEGLAYALGGAVYADEDATVSLEKTRFFGNWAVSESSDAYGGAGAFATGSAEVTACVFDGNGVAATNVYYGGALDFAGTDALVKNSTFRGSNVEAVDAYGANLAFTNCVVVGNATRNDVEGDGFYSDIYAEESTVDVAWTAYGTYDINGEVSSVFDDAANHNLPGSTTAIYDPAANAEPTLNPEGYVPAAALGLDQEATDVNRIAYGSKFWGYSMGAYECHTYRDMREGVIVTVDPEEYAWTGMPIEPHGPVHVYDTIVGSNLVEGVDYMLSWSDNINPTDRAIVTATGTAQDYIFSAGTNFWITAYYVDYYLDDATEPFHTLMNGELSHTNVTAQIAPPAGYAYDPITSMPTGTVRRYDGECAYPHNGQLALIVRYVKDEGGDEIPDIYQKKMSLKVVNGWWNGEQNGADKTYWVTLYDEEGKWSKDGTGVLGVNPTNSAEMVVLPTAGERPFSDFTASGKWWYLSGSPDFTNIVAPAGLEVRSGSWPFVIFLYDRKNESAGGRTGRGGRGGSTSTDAVADYKLRASLKISQFAYDDGTASGEAWASVVDESTGQTVLNELLRRTKVNVLAADSLEGGEWNVIGSPTTDGEGGWNVDGGAAAETPAQMFYKLQLR